MAGARIPDCAPWAALGHRPSSSVTAPGRRMRAADGARGRRVWRRAAASWPAMGLCRPARGGGPPGGPPPQSSVEAASASPADGSRLPASPREVACCSCVLFQLLNLQAPPKKLADGPGPRTSALREFPHRFTWHSSCAELGARLHSGARELHRESSRLRGTPAPLRQEPDQSHGEIPSHPAKRLRAACMHSKTLVDREVDRLGCLVLR